jgi:hypothetical protein
MYAFVFPMKFGNICELEVNMVPATNPSQGMHWKHINCPIDKMAYRTLLEN